MSQVRDEVWDVLNVVPDMNQFWDLNPHRGKIWQGRPQLGSSCNFLSHPSTAVIMSSYHSVLDLSPLSLSLCLLLSLLSALPYSYEWSVCPGHSPGGWS